MSFRKEDIQFALDYIHTLNIPAAFGITDDCGGTDIQRLCEGLANDSMLRPRLYHGVSKAVLDFSELPFVIKIPLNGMWYYDYDKDDGESEIFSCFCCANDLYPDDYCWDEYRKTEMLEIFGFGELVPEMELLCTVNGRNFYAQEKVTPAFRDGILSHASQHSMELSKRLAPEYKICDDEWRAAVIEFYGVDYWINFCKWDEDNNTDILSDMHMDNYGYAADGRPVIFDLSGFRD